MNQNNFVLCDEYSDLLLTCIIVYYDVNDYNKGFVRVYF